jgi:phosphonate transport system ATP-binding protein
VSLEIREGEITVLLGSSGAGKSTLLRCLNHLQVPTSGRIRIRSGGDLRNPRTLREHRRSTGMIFQLHQLIERQTALRNVLMGRIGYYPTLRSLFPLPRREYELALECLARVSLAEKALTRVDQLSGGQRQRVGIARTLAQQPRLVLADEPVASLDPATSEDILELLRKVCREDGLTAVVSLHQVELARRFADRIVGLAHGRVVCDGGIGDLDLERIYEAKEPRKERKVQHDPEYVAGH